MAFFLLPIETAAQINELEMKAAFLEKFSKFVEWPDNSSITDTTKPFIIGIIGRSPFNSILEDTYASQKIKGKAVEIQYFSDLKDISTCHLLFIARSKRRELPDILNITKDKPILTVSDTEGWAKKGVLINLFMAQNNVGFEINEDAVTESILSMRYQLKQWAKIVHFDEL